MYHGVSITKFNYSKLFTVVSPDYREVGAGQSDEEGIEGETSVVMGYKEFLFQGLSVQV